MTRMLLLTVVLAWAAMTFQDGKTSAGQDQSGASSASAKIVVQLPADAKLYFDDQLTTSTGAKRTFTTPPVSGNKVHHYTLKAQFTRQGKVVTETKEISFRAGQTIQVIFGNMVPVRSPAALKAEAGEKKKLAGAPSPQAFSKEAQVTLQLIRNTVKDLQAGALNVQKVDQLLGGKKEQPEAARVSGLVARLKEQNVPVIVKVRLVHLGQPAVPALIQALRHPDSRVNATLVLAAMGEPAAPALIKALQDDSLRLWAQLALVGMESPGIPRLIQALKEKDSQAHAAGVLVLIGEPAVAPLRRELDQQGSAVRTMAVAVLVQLIPRTKSALPALLEALTRDDAQLRADVLAGLTEFGPVAVPPLLQTLKDSPDEKLRKAATAALIKIGSPAVPALLQALKETGSKNLGVHATATLVGIGTPEVSAGLVQLLQGDDPKVCQKAGTALGIIILKLPADSRSAARKDQLTRSLLTAVARQEQLAAVAQEFGWDWPNVTRDLVSVLGGLGPAALPTLRAAMYEDDQRTAFIAVLALAQMGKTSVPVLIEAFKDGRSAARAIRALERMGAVAVPNLIEVLKGRDQASQLFALWTLARIGPSAKAAVPALIESLQTFPMPWIAAYALGRIGPDAKAAVPALTAALKSPESKARVGAALALWQIAKDRTAVSTLVEALKHHDHLVRQGALAALGQIGPDARSAVPALSAALKDKNGVVPPVAASALGRIGSDARAAVPALSATLQGVNPLLRRAAAAALGRLGPEAKPAVPALLRILEQKKEDPLEGLLEMADKNRHQMDLMLPWVNEVQDDHRYGDERVAAAWAVWQIGQHPGAVVVLAAALKDKRESVRRAAAQVLGEIGAKAKAAVPFLVEALKDKDRPVRVAAAEALKKIDPAAAAKRVK